MILPSEIKPQLPACRESRVTRPGAWSATLAACLFGGLAIQLAGLSPYALMWALSAALFFALKALVILRSGQGGLAFVFGWPGMDAAAFGRQIPASGRTRPDVRLVLRSLLWLSAGLFHIFGLSGMEPRWLGAWLGMAGIIFAAHCGAFGLIAAGWRWLGRDIQPIMRAPVLAVSLREFWGDRWNLAFSDAASLLIVRPLWRKLGLQRTLMVVFLISGLVHELVITVPARGGYGGPTAYFLLQGLGQVWERAQPLRSALLQRLRLWLVLLLPLPLLFPQPFVLRVMAPLFDSLRSALAL